MQWCPHHFPQSEKNSTLLTVESSHVISQSGHGGDLGIISRASSPKQGSEGGTGLRDKPTTVDGKSGRAYAAEKVGSISLKNELIPRSHGKSNSSDRNNPP